MKRFRTAGERGAAIAEAVFVVPVLFLVVLGLFDLGQWEFQSSQASGAARDGARAGLMAYTTAAGTTAAPGGAGFTAVNSAVSARLAGQGFTVAVTCVGPADEVAISCSAAKPDADRIRVVVSWTRSPLSPVTQPFGIQQVSGKAVMRVVGAPE